MVALYRLTDDKCNFWPHFVIRPPNVPLYSLTGEKYNLWPHFVIGPPNGPLYRLTGEKCNFWPYFVIGPPSGPLYRLTGDKYNFWPHFDSILSYDHQMFPHTGAVFGHTFRVCQQMVNLSFKIGGGLNGPLPFAGSL